MENENKTNELVSKFIEGNSEYPKVIIETCFKLVEKMEGKQGKDIEFHLNCVGKAIDALVCEHNVNVKKLVSENDSRAFRPQRRHLFSAER